MAEDVYTHGHHESVLRSHRWRTAENSAAYLLPHLSGGLELLDVGCGPGTITLDLAERVAPGQVLGVDASAEVVDAAEAARAERGTANAAFSVADVYDLDLPDGAYDVAHAHQVLQHLTDPVAALRELRRVVKPGGLVACRDSDYAAMVWAPDEPLLHRWLDLYHQVTRRNDAEADAGRYLPAWARAAGFSEVTYSSSTWTYATAEERAWWGELWADRVQHSSFAEQAVEYGLAATDELAEIGAAWRAWAADPDGVFLVVHGEVLARP